MRKSFWRIALSLATAALLTAATAGTVAAQTTDSSAQVEYALTGSEVTSSSLPGSAAGAFAYYRIAYPGNETELRIQVRFAQYEGSISPLGFNVYGPNGRVDVGDWQTDNDCLEVTYQEDGATDLLVQVYNYGTANVAYTIAAVGLPQVEATPAAAEVAVETTPVASATDATPESAASTEWSSVSGVVIGNRGGAFGQHVIESTGDGEDITVTMTVSPADPSFMVPFGLNVYNPNGDLVATAAPTGEQGVREATWASDVAGSYYVQVYNYSDGVTMYYTLEVAD